MNSSLSSAKKHLPNVLSFLRIVFAFILIPIIRKNNFLLAAVMFFMAALSDFLDGYLARKWNAASPIGAALDPLADKILIIISYYLLSAHGHIPSYAAILVIGRDILILLVVVSCRLKNVTLPMNPSMPSKINTALQLVFIIVVLSCKCLSMNVPFTIVFCALIVCVSTIVSGWEYAQKYFWIKDAILK